MNPLLNPSPLKHAAVPFNAIKPEHFTPALDEAIRRGHERLKEIKAKPASFEHTFRGLESCTEEMEFVFSLFSNLLLAHGNDELQKLSVELGPKVSAFANDILLDADVFARVSEVYKNRNSLGLGKEQMRLVDKVFRDFERSGAGLPADKKARLRAIDDRWSQLSPKFRENVLRSTNMFELWLDDEKDLAGLPPTQKTAAREAAAEKGATHALANHAAIPFVWSVS